MRIDDDPSPAWTTAFVSPPDTNGAGYFTTIDRLMSNSP